MANLYEIRRKIADFEFEVDPETGELLNAMSWDELNMAYFEGEYDANCAVMVLDSIITIVDFEEGSENV